MADAFGARADLRAGDRTYTIYRLDALGDQVRRLPYSLKILLENLLRHEGGPSVTVGDVDQLARWNPHEADPPELEFSPARILMQDFTGVPCIVDLAAMRDAVVEFGGAATHVNPLVPAELVVDHSIQVDVFGVPDAFQRNAEFEFARNEERYRFLRWGQQAFDNLVVVPPNTGICHQVNLEHLARVVFVDGDGNAYPDTLVGTDSHTPMVNGLGVLGWGVGGIEAEAAMLGQPISMLTPRVVGFRLSGALPEGSTATDLVLTVTEMLRRHGVVGKFVEFFGPGVGSVPLENRATIGNMSPEYGSTVTIFPIDDETLRYLEFTGRHPDQIELVRVYAHEQGLWHDPNANPTYSEHLELDLSTVVPSLAGPSRPQDRVPLDVAKPRFRSALVRYLAEHPDARGADDLPFEVVEASPEDASADSFPASDPPAAGQAVTGVGLPNHDIQTVVDVADRPTVVDVVDRPTGTAVPVRLSDGTEFELDHGHVAIAAITSCTNTSNPSVMIAAALVARNAVERGLDVQPWVKTSLAPGSQVVMDYYERSGLLPYLEKLRFNLVGYGCTTCIGNSGPLAPEIAQAIEEHGLSVVSVLSGNRNFEGRINPDVRMNYLMSPPLVVAYALAGTMDIDLRTEPLGIGTDGEPVYLRDVWPDDTEVQKIIQDSLRPEMFEQRYARVLEGEPRWRDLDVPAGERFTWDPESTYVREPPFFEGLSLEPAPLADVKGARVLAVLGDSVTTDHISPAGAIRGDSPAAEWLRAHGVELKDFNSYGSRRGNHEVMIRGTFANPRIRNQIAPGTEGGYTRHLPEREPTTIYDAAMKYAAEGTPLVVLAGKEYGSGSSRDWAAKGTALLGIRAVIAESFERIHRSNLIGMGVLPLEFMPGDSAASLKLTGEEVFEIDGLANCGPDEPLPEVLTVRAGKRQFDVRLRIDTPVEEDWFRHGGVLPFVARNLARR